MGISISLLKLFCRERTGEFARALFCGIELNCLDWIESCEFFTGSDFFTTPLTGSTRIICGFSLTQEYKNSFENDLSFELTIDDDIDDDDDSDDVNELELLVFLVVQETEETEEEAEEGERGERGCLVEEKEEE